MKVFCIKGLEKKSVYMALSQTEIIASKYVSHAFSEMQSIPLNQKDFI